MRRDFVKESIPRLTIKILKYGIFISILGICIGGLVFVVSPHADRDSLWWSYKSLPFNSVDVLLTGTSKVHSNVNPRVLDETANLSAFDLSGSSMDLRTTYWYLKEGLRTQKPKVIAIELLMLKNKNWPTSDMQKRNIINMPLVPRIVTTLALIKPSSWERWISPVTQYHSRAFAGENKINNSDFQSTKWEEPENITRGFRSIDASKPHEPQSKPTPIDEALYRDNFMLMKRNIKLAHSHGAEVVLFNSPDVVYDDMDVYSQRLVADLTDEGIEVTYIGHEDYADEVDLDYNKDFGDKLHLNRGGADKFSTWFASRLSAIIKQLNDGMPTEEFLSKHIRF